MSTFDSRELRNAFGTFMTGVTVVTTVTKEGVPVGFTANSYTSVSLDPALVLVCPAKSLSSFDAFNECEHFVINILSEDQQDVSNIFASATEDRFEKVAWQANEWGVPVLQNTVTHFSCSAHQRVEAGDHIVLMGEVQAFQTSDAYGLGYGKGGYFSLGMERRAAERPNTNQPETVGAIIEHDEQVLLVETEKGYCLPTTQATSEVGSLAAIQAYLKEAELPFALGSVYSIFENKQSGGRSTYYRATAEDNNTHELGCYFPIHELATLRFASQPLTIMMQRYCLEAQSGNFGVYVGNDEQGDVHTFTKGA